MPAQHRPAQHLYRVEFSGRKTGAIGIFYPVVLEIDAASPEGAIARMARTHELEGPPPRVSVRAHVCPNCEQWQYVGADCSNECIKRGFATRVQLYRADQIYQADYRAEQARVEPDDPPTPDTKGH
jgi:hypothetical protein